MAPLPPRVEAMVAELAALDALEDKYDALIEMGRAVPELPEALKTPERRVLGCQSLVHVAVGLGPDGRVELGGHADALIVNGLLALLVLGLDRSTPEEFLAVDPRFIEATGVLKALTPSRSNGFYNIHRKLAEGVRALGRPAAPPAR